LDLFSKTWWFDGKAQIIGCDSDNVVHKQIIVLKEVVALNNAHVFFLVVSLLCEFDLRSNCWTSWENGR
jgi:hypothetical protein